MAGILDKPKDIFLPTGEYANYFIISGEKILNGQIQWDRDKEADFIISREDPRVENLMETAKRIRSSGKDLPPAEREKAIVEYLQWKISEQFGEYNPGVAAELQLRDAEKGGNKKEIDAAKDRLQKLKDGHSKATGKAFTDFTHDDWERKDTKKPASLTEFKNDELVCRQFAPLMSMACTEAGVPNLMVFGHVTSEGSKTIGHHAYVVSRTTCSVIDPSGSVMNVYNKNISGVTLNDILLGKSFAVASDAKSVSVYGSGYVPSFNNDLLIESRRGAIFPNPGKPMIDLGQIRTLPAPMTDPLLKHDTQLIAKWRNASTFTNSDYYKLGADIIKRRAQTEEPIKQEYIQALRSGNLAGALALAPHLTNTPIAELHSDKISAVSLAVEKNDIAALKKIIKDKHYTQADIRIAADHAIEHNLGEAFAALHNPKDYDHQSLVKLYSKVRKQPDNKALLDVMETRTPTIARDTLWRLALKQENAEDFKLLLESHPFKKEELTSVAVSTDQHVSWRDKADSAVIKSINLLIAKGANWPSNYVDHRLHHLKLDCIGSISKKELNGAIEAVIKRRDDANDFKHGDLQKKVAHLTEYDRHIAIAEQQAKEQPGTPVERLIKEQAKLIVAGEEARKIPASIIALGDKMPALAPVDFARLLRPSREMVDISVEREAPKTPPASFDITAVISDLARATSKHEETPELPQIASLDIPRTRAPAPTPAIMVEEIAVPQPVVVATRAPAPEPYPNPQIDAEDKNTKSQGANFNPMSIIAALAALAVGALGLAITGTGLMGIAVAALFAGATFMATKLLPPANTPENNPLAASAELNNFFAQCEALQMVQSPISPTMDASLTQYHRGYRPFDTTERNRTDAPSVHGTPINLPGWRK